jgi:transposase
MAQKFHSCSSIQIIAMTKFTTVVGCFDKRYDRGRDDILETKNGRFSKSEILNFLNSRLKLILQDGATCHTALRTQDWLLRNVPDFIAKDQWPPRSPDLNPLDYSVWSILEDRACREPHETIESLKAALRREWEALDPNTISRIIDDFPRRLVACIEAEGRHFE